MSMFAVYNTRQIHIFGRPSISQIFEILEARNREATQIIQTSMQVIAQHSKMKRGSSSTTEDGAINA